MTDRQAKLFARAEEILAGRSNGLGEPILWHLALRRHGPAMLEIANRATRQGQHRELGRFSDPFSPLGLMYRAWRQGEANAAQNLAMTLFWVRDMAGYRYWLAKAANAGDPEARSELSRFETCQPYGLARKQRRLRPFRRDGS